MRIKDVFSRDRDRLKGQSKMGMIRAGGANHVAFLQAERMGTAEERREDRVQKIIR